VRVLFLIFFFVNNNSSEPAGYAEEEAKESVSQKVSRNCACEYFSLTIPKSHRKVTAAAAAATTTTKE